MTPYDNSDDKSEQNVRDLSLELRNWWHLDRYKSRAAKPAKRDKDGFKVRRPKLITAIGLTAVAVMTGIVGVFIKRRNRY